MKLDILFDPRGAKKKTAGMRKFDLASRRVLKAVLEKSGFEVIAVEDGVKAWEALQIPEPPRFAIVDWMMPGLDGIGLLRKIRPSATMWRVRCSLAPKS